MTSKLAGVLVFLEQADISVLKIRHSLGLWSTFAGPPLFLLHAAGDGAGGWLAFDNYIGFHSPSRKRNQMSRTPPTKIPAGCDLTIVTMDNSDNSRGMKDSIWPTYTSLSMLTKALCHARLYIARMCCMQSSRCARTYVRRSQTSRQQCVSIIAGAPRARNAAKDLHLRFDFTRLLTDYERTRWGCERQREMPIVARHDVTL